MLWSDFRHSIRGLIRMPGFTLICMLTLALGIGATTSIFSAIYHTILRPMPFPGGDRLAYVWMTDSAMGMGIAPARPYLEAWRSRLRSFEAIESYNSGEYTLLGGQEAELVKGAAISLGLPAMLGVQPILGRTFTSDEMQSNGRNVIVLSEGLWKRRFGGSRDVLGKTVELTDGRYEVVGVLPNVFSAFENFQHEGQMWLPLRPDTSSSALRDVNVIGRLKEGVTEKAAAADLALASSGVKEDIGLPGKWAPTVSKPDIGDSTRVGLKVLFAAVAMVLLIGCANIAGLLLVRLNARRREIAIRAAVGARRVTIVRLLMVESVLIALGGGALGMFLSSWITTAIRMVRPDSLNSLDAITTDRTTLYFALLLSVVTSVFFGVAPIISAMRRDLTGGLINNASGGRVTSGNRMRSVMVGGQIALSLILLVASLLLVRSVKQLQSKDLGFNPKDALTFGVQLRKGGTEATNKAFFDAFVPALRRLPGVTAVSLSTGVPSKSGVMFGEATVPGRELKASEKPGLLGYTASTPEYVNTIGLRIRQGRFFREKESGNPIVINEGWAKQLWPGETAVGKQIHLGNAEENMTIVGVVAEVSGMGPTMSEKRPSIYVPYNFANPRASIVIRTNGTTPAGSLVPAVRAALRNADATLVARDMATLEDLMADTIALDRFYMTLLSSFAALALVLSVVGLYGVISHAVAQRTREIGVRMALGATPASVQRMVFTQALKIVAAGIGIGVVASYVLVRYLESTLHGFSPHDPVSFVTAVVVLTAGAMFATYIPARRAVRVHPLDALRTE